jgi:hypothetical protein
MSQRDYNKVYIWGRIIIQIMQDGQHDGIVIKVLPTLEVAINNGRLIAGFAIRWIVSDLCFGIMTREFKKRERERRRSVCDAAAKAGLTIRQQELRWGW